MRPLPYMPSSAPKMVCVRRRKRPPRRFRWQLVAVPLAIAISMYFLDHIRFSIDFESVMDFLDVQDRPRYRQLAMLCVIGVAVCLVFRLWRKPAKDDE